MRIENTLHNGRSTVKKPEIPDYTRGLLDYIKTGDADSLVAVETPGRGAGWWRSVSIEELLTIHSQLISLLPSDSLLDPATHIRAGEFLAQAIVPLDSMHDQPSEANSPPGALGTLSTLLRIGEIITSSLDIRLTFEQFAEHFRLLVPFDRLDIVLIDSDIGTYTDGYVIDRDKPGYRAGEVHELKGSLVGEIARQRRSIILDGSMDTTTPRSGGSTSFPERFPSLLGVPLVWNNEPVGVLLARSLEPESYDEGNRIAALGASTLIASAIANSRQYQSVVTLAAEREMRVRLNAENDALAEAIKGRDDFVIEASHELKTPLASIVACADLLLADPSSTPEQRELSEIIRRNSSVLNDLIADLGDSTGLDAGMLLVSITTESVREILTEVIQRFEVTLRARRQSLQLVLTDDDIVVFADRRRLGQALSNLLSNASKFSDEGTNIYLECVAEPEWVKVMIRDQGIGIPQHEIEKVFDPFFRGADPEVEARSGSGTGLFIANKLIEYQGGSITLVSERGMGTTVTVTLPGSPREGPRRAGLRAAPKDAA